MPLFGKFHFLSLKAEGRLQFANFLGKVCLLKSRALEDCAYFHFSTSQFLIISTLNILLCVEKKWIWILPRLWHVYGSLGSAWDIYWPGDGGTNTALVSNFENISVSWSLFLVIGNLILLWWTKTSFTRFWDQALWDKFWHWGLAKLKYPETRSWCSSTICNLRLSSTKYMCDQFS